MLFSSEHSEKIGQNESAHCIYVPLELLKEIWEKIRKRQIRDNFPRMDFNLSLHEISQEPRYLEILHRTF